MSRGREAALDGDPSAAEEVQPLVVLIGVLAVISLGLSLSTKGADDYLDENTGGGSARERCVEKWEANRSFAETDYMTEERYVNNCVITERDLEDGTFDGN